MGGASPMGGLGGGLSSAIGAAAAQPAPPTASHVGGDPFVRVLSETVLSPEATEVKIYLEPTTGALRNLSLQFDVPPQLRVALTAPPPASIAGVRATIPMLSPGGALCLVASVTCADSISEAALLGQLSYSDSAGGDSRIVSYRIPIGLRSLLRPNPIATPQFGQMWQTGHSAEKKSTIAPCEVAADPNSYMGRIETKLNISPVQTIGMECIASGKLVGSNVTCLVHGKLGQMNGRAVDLTVRTRDPRLSDSMQRVATEILQDAP